MLIQDLPPPSSSCLGEGEDAGADDFHWSFFSLSLHDSSMELCRTPMRWHLGTYQELLGVYVAFALAQETKI